MLKLLKYLTAILLAALGLYIFFRKSGNGDEAVYETLINEISRTSITNILICAVLTLLAVWLRALRLRILLPDTLPAPLLPQAAATLEALAIRPAAHKGGLFSITAIALAVNNILPIRIGEAARIALLWKRNGFPVAVCIGSLLLERALDIAAYLSFLFVPLLLSPRLFAGLQGTSPLVTTAMWLAVAAFATLIGVFSLYALVPRIFRGAALRVAKHMPGAIQRVARKVGAEIESNLDWTSSPRKIAAVSALTYAIALCYSSMLLILSWDVPNFGFLDSLFAQAFAAFGAAIPLTPGSVGTLHAVLLQGMTIVGVEAPRARAIIVVYHAVQYLVVTGFGVLFLFGLKMRLRDIAGIKVKKP